MAREYQSMLMKESGWQCHFSVFEFAGRHRNDVKARIEDGTQAQEPGVV